MTGEPVHATSKERIAPDFILLNMCPLLKSEIVITLHFQLPVC